MMKTLLKIAAVVSLSVATYVGIFAGLSMIAGPVVTIIVASLVATLNGLLLADNLFGDPE